MYSEVLTNDSKKAIFSFGQMVEKIRIKLSKDERLALQRVISPFAVGRVDIEKAYRKLYTCCYNLNVSNELGLDEYFESVATVKIDFSDFEELQFCFTLGITSPNLDEVYTFAEASKLWGLADAATLRKAKATGRFLPGEIRDSGGFTLVTKAAMIRLYGEMKK